VDPLTDTPPPESPQVEDITVVIIDDNRLVREAITLMLNRYPGIRVIASEANDEGWMPNGVDPQVILLDLGLESGDSLRMAKSVQSGFPDTHVIVMDLLPAQEEIREFVSAGVSGFILKDASLETVVGTIRSVASGIKVLPPEMAGTLFSEIAKVTVGRGGTEDDESVRLTPREREVIDLIAEGLSNKAIGNRLYISTHTVKSHLRNIMEKLTLHSRLQIAAYAHQRDGEE
jgi:DNA-binding NarL/FixJ family response regulator